MFVTHCVHAHVEKICTWFQTYQIQCHMKRIYHGRAISHFCLQYKISLKHQKRLLTHLTLQVTCAWMLAVMKGKSLRSQASTGRQQAITWASIDPYIYVCIYIYMYIYIHVYHHIASLGSSDLTWYKQLMLACLLNFSEDDSRQMEHYSETGPGIISVWARNHLWSVRTIWILPVPSQGILD